MPLVIKRIRIEGEGNLFLWLVQRVYRLIGKGRGIGKEKKRQRKKKEKEIGVFNLIANFQRIFERSIEYMYNPRIGQASHA